MAYDAAMDEHRWPSFLEAFASAVGGSSAILRSNDTQTHSASFNASVGYDMAWQKAYCNHFVKLDYFNHVMNQYSSGKIFSSDHNIDQSQLRKGEYYNDYLRPQNKMHALGSFLLKTDEHSLVLGVQRSRLSGAFRDKDFQFMANLAPHITRAVQVHRKILSTTADKEHAHSALDQMRMGVILTNRLGTPLYINRTAELMMTQDVGLGVFHNKLAAHSPSETAKLHKLITDTSLGVNSSTVGGDMRITMPNQIGFLHCVVMPVSQKIPYLMNDVIGTDCVAVFLSKPGHLQLSPKRLVTLYKITPAEARLAARLAALRTVEEASDELGISIPTARTQLKSVFSKTGTRSQSELLMLLATGTLAHLGDA